MLAVRHGFFCVIVLMQESLTGALGLSRIILQKGGRNLYTARDAVTEFTDTDIQEKKGF